MYRLAPTFQKRLVYPPKYYPMSPKFLDIVPSVVSEGVWGMFDLGGGGRDIGGGGIWP